MDSSETTYWLELLVEAGIFPPEQLADLLDESIQIKAMLIASINTTNARL